MVLFGRNKNPLEDKPAKWFPKGKKACVHGRDLKNGFLYIGRENDSEEHDGIGAPLIDPSLPAAKSASGDSGIYIGYYPHYSEIHKKCRGEYLDWLADGCKDPDADMSYVFLYFYGLERRLLVDLQDDESSAAERKNIVKEILRLLSIYGKNNSFNGYANSLLIAEWLVFQKTKKPPEYISIYNVKRSEPIRIELGLHASENRPLPPELALRWYIMHQDYKLKTPARRCLKEFPQIFDSDYHNAHREGIYLPKNRKNIKFYFYPASPSIGGFYMKVGLPDCFDATAQLNQIKKVVDKSTEQLEDYSRHLAKSKRGEDNLRELSLLPPVIVNKRKKAIFAQRALQSKCKNEIWFPKIKEVYKTINEKPPKELGRSEQADLSAFLQVLGFGTCPDIRYHNIKLKLTSNVSIFRCPFSAKFKPSQHFYELSSILRLGAIISRIDGHIHRNEVKILNNRIDEARNIDVTERAYSDAFLHWCFHAAEEESLSSKGVAPYLKKLTKHFRRHFGDLLIHIIYADHQIKEEEVAKLEKFYKLLGLETGNVHTDIHNMYGEIAMGRGSATGPVKVADAEPVTKYQIPKRPIGGTSEKILLDEAKIKILKKEEYKELAGIFAGTEKEQVIEDKVESKKVDASQKLNKNCHKLFEYIIKKEIWQKKELVDFCSKSKIMLDGAVEGINEWAYEMTNAPLVSEFNEILQVDADIVQELKDG